MSNDCNREREVNGGTPFAEARGLAHVIGGNRLACLIANCHRLLRHKYRQSPLWSMVADITGHGSTISCEICKQAGYDPHQSCGAKDLKRSAPNDALCEGAKGNDEKH